MSLRTMGGGLVNSNVSRIRSGTATPSANGILTSFAIAHGLGTTPTSYDVVAGSTLAAAVNYVTADATNLTITFLVAPLTGTLTLNWTAMV